MDAFKILINGSEDKELETDISRLTVESRVGMPGMMHLIVGDSDRFTYVDSTKFSIGNEFEIKAQSIDSKSFVSIFKGIITAMEPEFTQDATIQIHVRGYDKSIKLSQGKNTRSFVKMSTADIIKKVASENGLTADASSSSPTKDQVIQLNQTDWEFVQYLAQMDGLKVTFQDNKLVCKPIGSISQTGIDLTWRQNLIKFIPRLSGLGQVSAVEMTGWDVKTKKEVTSKVTSGQPTKYYSIGESTAGSAAGKKVSGGSPSHNALDISGKSIDEMKTAAQGAFDAQESLFVTAEGEALGDPRLVAGSMVNVKDLGTRFSGKYFITTARHEFTQGQYRVIFGIHGGRPRTISGMLGGDANHADNRVPGVVPAIVTNNNDSGDVQAARVKVKYPWFPSGTSGTLESDWARVATIGGGKERGIYFMPEIDDEVLVAFEQGDINRPYILGGLWNGKDAPPDTVSNVVKSGKVSVRMIKSRTGHLIKLEESDSVEKITIVDKSTKNSIELDAKAGTITVKSDKDMIFDAGGKMTFNCKGDLEVTSKGAGKMKAQNNFDIEAATGAMNMKAMGAMKMASKQSIALQDAGPNKVNIGPAGVDVQGIKASVKGSAMTEISGALVKIN